MFIRKVKCNIFREGVFRTDGSVNFKRNYVTQPQSYTCERNLTTVFTTSLFCKTHTAGNGILFSS